MPGISAKPALRFEIMTDWRPIETLPPLTRDERRVLLRFPIGREEVEYVIARWTPYNGGLWLDSDADQPLHNQSPSHWASIDEPEILLERLVEAAFEVWNSTNNQHIASRDNLRAALGAVLKAKP